MSQNSLKAWATSLLVALLLAGIPCSGQSESNPEFQESEFIPFFQKKDPTLVHFDTFYKKDLDGTHTLLMIRAGREPPTNSDPKTFFSSTTSGWPEWLGLFLVKPAQPNWIRELTYLLSNSHSYGGINVERVDDKSIVLHQTEYDYRRPRELKLFLNAESGQLLKRLEYTPLRVEQILELKNELYFVIGGPRDLEVDFRQQELGQERVARLDGDRLIVVTGTERDSLLTHAREELVPRRWNFIGRREFIDAPREYRPFGDQGLFAVTVVVNANNHVFENIEGIAERVGNDYKLQKLPKTTPEQLAKADPWNDWTNTDYDPLEEEGIGPYQIAGNRFWFAKTFYNSEGFTGTGGFGYFDADERRYVLFRPPQIIPWSVSSLLVEEQNVWLGLVGRPEGAEYSGGLMRYDRETGQVELFQVSANACVSKGRICSYEVITQIKRWRDSLYMATHHGLLIFRGNRLTLYTFEPSIDGGIEVHTISTISP